MKRLKFIRPPIIKRGTTESSQKVIKYAKAGGMPKLSMIAG